MVNNGSLRWVTLLFLLLIHIKFIYSCQIYTLENGRYSQFLGLRLSKINRATFQRENAHLAELGTAPFLILIKSNSSSD
jgi:hypothetical protein